MARSDGWKVSIARVGRKPRGWSWVFFLDDVLLLERPPVPARAAAGVQLQQGVNRVVLEMMTQFGVMCQGCVKLGTGASGDAWVLLHSHGCESCVDLRI